MLVLHLVDLVIVERKDLDEKAKKGLESREDIKGASQGLKKTEKDRSGISKERINQYDGIKPVMLLHVKGKNCYLYLVNRVKD